MQSGAPSMNVALVHEHLAQDGGAERVVRVLRQLYPQAPLFTLMYNPDRAHADFQGADIRTSFLQRLPGAQRHYQWYLPLMPTAVELYDLTPYDLVISSASAFAKGVITAPNALHICYLHSPTRYLWNDSRQYVADLPYPRWMKGLISRHLTGLRQWDRLAADRPDEIVANSRTVERRITKYYRRSSTVIHPPVEVDRFTVATGPGSYYIAGGRLVPYKRFDLIVEAFNHLGLPLKIFGDGPAGAALRQRAKPNIEFLGRVAEADLPGLYAGAIAFLNPQEEDFGITVVEAMAAGRPVIAYAAGGALETVKPGLSGVFFQDQEWESLADAVIRFRPEDYPARAIHDWAETFGVDRFKTAMSNFVAQAWQQRQKALH